MTDKLLNAIKAKADNLEDLKHRFDTLFQRAEKDKQQGTSISLPEFEAFGWERFEEFLGRLEEAVNTPLLEEARRVLDEIEVSMSTLILERLKSGLSVRREALIQILQDMSKKLREIETTELRFKAGEEIARCLEEGRWDDLVTKANDWHKLQEELASILKAMNEKALAYKAVFDKALEEGPSTRIIEKLVVLETKAYQLGTDLLKERIKFEKVESQIDPLGNIEDLLGEIAKKKESIRQNKGTDISISNLIGPDDSLKKVAEKLENERANIQEEFEEEYRQTEKLLRKYKNLATLLKRGLRSMPAESNLKQLNEMKDQLSKDIESLETELRESFSRDAREFIDCLLDGRIPDEWKSDQIVKVLREIINAGYSFEIKMVEQ